MRVDTSTFIGAAGAAFLLLAGIGSVRAEAGDLQVTRVTGPARVTLGKGPPKSSRITVGVTNSGQADVTIVDAYMLSRVVRLEVEALGACRAPSVLRSPPKKFPLTIRPGRSLNVAFRVTFDCAGDRAAGAGHEDFRLRATVHDEALDGKRDDGADDEDASTLVDVVLKGAAENAAPVFGKIAKAKVRVGETLYLDIPVAPLDPGPLSSFVSPLPLPRNATYDSRTGRFTFRPETDQVGRYTLTFRASDGVNEVGKRVVVSVKKPKTGPTSLRGRVLDTSSFLGGREVPVVGARISLLGTQAESVTDRKGRFNLTGIPVGELVLDIDASEARAAPDGSAYAGFREAIHVCEGLANTHTRPFFLPRLAMGSLTTVDPNATTVVQNTDLGITLTVPPHTAKGPDGQDFTGQLSISEVPEGLAPAAMPPEYEPGLLITIQPVGVTFATPVPISFPNDDGLAPGSEIDIFSLDPEIGAFAAVGRGVVSQDGTRIDTVEGGVRAADWHFPLSPDPAPTPPDDDDPECDDPEDKKCEVDSGSSVSPVTGVLRTDFSLPGHTSLSTYRALRFVYSTARACPHPVTTSQITIPVRSAVPDLVSYSLSVEGGDQGRETFVDTSMLDEDRDETIHVAADLDATGLATGTYANTLRLTSHFGGSRRSTMIRRQFSLVNGRGSPFGAGWDLGGLRRVVRNTDGSVLLLDGNGLVARFTPSLTDRRDFLVQDSANDAVLRINAVTGAVEDVLVESGSGGLDTPHNPTIGPDGALYVFSNADTILRYDGVTGEFIDTFVPRGTAGLAGSKMVFGPDGNLYTANPALGKVLRFSGGTGEFLGVAAQGNGIRRACGIAFDDQGILLVLDADSSGSSLTDRILRFDGITGAFLGEFVAGGNLGDACDFAVGPDGDLFVTDVHFADIRRFDGTTGAFEGSFASGPPLTFPSGLTFGPDGNLYVNNAGNTLRFDGSTGQFIDTFVPGFGGFGTFYPALPGTGAAYVGPPGGSAVLDRALDGTIFLTEMDGTVQRFDADDRLASVEDPSGNRQTYAYDASGRLESIVDPAGLETTFAYAKGADGRISKVTDPVGRVTSFTHDGDGNLVAVQFPGGGSRTFAYDPRHLMTSETDPLGNTVEREYDAFDRWTRSLFPDGTERTGTHAQLAALVDPASGLGTQAGPAPAVRPADVKGTFTDGAGGTTTYVAGALQSAAAVTDGTGVASVLERDRRGNVVRHSLPGADVLTLSYDQRGNLVSLTSDEFGGSQTYTWDARFNRVASATNPVGDTTTVTYDDGGNLDRYESAAGRVYDLDADPRGLATRLTLPDGGVLRYAYDPQGNLTTITGGPVGREHVTRLEYDAAGDNTAFVRPGGRRTQMRYDAQGDLVGVTRPDGGVVGVSRDLAGNVLSLTPPGRPPHVFTYGSNGLMATYAPPAVGAEANTFGYAYDGAGRLTRVTRPDGRPVDLVWDAAGRLDTVTVARGVFDHTHAPDSGLLVRIDAPGQVRLDLSYSGTVLDGEVLSGPVAGSIGFHFDAAGRVIGRTVGGRPQVTYVYDPDGAVERAGAVEVAHSPGTDQVSLVTLGTAVESYGYDDFGAVQSQIFVQDGNPLYSAIYEHDADGRISQVTETIEGATQTLDYTYDTAGRLFEIKEGDVTLASYGYDANDNRTSATLVGPGFSATYDDQDRIVSQGTSTFTHAPSGERTRRQDGPEVTTYDYDELGNLLEVVRPDGVRVTYLVDGRGRRVGRRVDGTLTHGWLYDHLGRVAAELDGAGAVRSEFVYGSHALVPDSMLRGGNTYRIVSDVRSSPRLVVDVATGAVVQRIDYDAWGRVVADTNPGFQPFGFAAGLYDPLTGLVRHGVRDYDGETGRFTARDPSLFLSGQTNQYTWVDDDPVNGIDPTGLGAVDAVGGFAGGQAAGRAVAAAGGNSAAVGAAGGAVAGGIAGAVAGSAIPGLGTVVGGVIGASAGAVAGAYRGPALKKAFADIRTYGPRALTELQDLADALRKALDSTSKCDTERREKIEAKLRLVSATMSLVRGAIKLAQLGC